MSTKGGGGVKNVQKSVHMVYEWPLRDEISQEESDLKKLDKLNPFIDISNIKALARKKYGARRHILQTACDKIKGMNY